MSLWCSKLTNNWGRENSQFSRFELRLLPNKRELFVYLTYQCNCLMAYLLYGHQDWINFNVEVEYRLFTLITYYYFIIIIIIIIWFVRLLALRPLLSHCSILGW
jgi:hypothetical protein